MKTSKEAYDAFIFHCKYEKKLSSKTIKAYETDCIQFKSFVKSKFKHETFITDINKDILKLFFYHLKELKPKTLKRKIATLKAMFNFLEYEDEILINPFRKMKVNIKECIVLPSVMSLLEVEKVLLIASNEITLCKPKTYTYFEKLRHLTVLELLFATGTRVSEICNLKIEDVDLVTGTIRIMGKGSRQRIVQVCHPDVLEILKLYRSRLSKKLIKKGYFFVNRLGTRLSEQSIRIMIKNYSSKAKINKKITPHTFRHSFATLMLEQNVDIKYIQVILGHSSISTTQIYTHINNRKQREILALNHPRILINSVLNKG
ncbi:MAG: tyrosine-type recombinase/integrase [Bacteroidota bacterium]|jgi:integrase/recombinase XerD|nr:tyrosine-type recombinase/integrase [Bacteroidota bacterium]